MMGPHLGGRGRRNDVLDVAPCEWALPPSQLDIISRRAAWCVIAMRAAVQAVDYLGSFGTLFTAMVSSLALGTQEKIQRTAS